MTKKNTALVIAIVIIVGLIIYLEKTKPSGPQPKNINVKNIQANPPELADIAGFINTAQYRNQQGEEKISIKDLIGKKVILIDFWTYSCINCKRTQPYLNDWYKKYKDDGLEIIGVHTPEFEFEKNYDNVSRAVIEENIKYPVVLDNNRATWQAYGNQYWPRKYLIDLNGHIVYDHIGEGAYEETEAKIQELLKAPIHPKTTAIEEANLDKIQSPEIYFGSSRQNKNNEVILSGTWLTTPEFIENQTSLAEINYTYSAKNVYMVAAADKPITVDVYVDDIKTKTITIQANNLYTLVIGQDYSTHKLKIKANTPGLKAYTFTFG